MIMPTEEELCGEPFCSKGCKHAYKHELNCVQPTSYKPAPDPSTYESLADEELVDVYDCLHTDHARYSTPPIDWSSPYRQYHQPTWKEAARRMALVRTEMLKRMK